MTIGTCHYKNPDFTYILNDINNSCSLPLIQSLLADRYKVDPDGTIICIWQEVEDAGYLIPVGIITGMFYAYRTGEFTPGGLYRQKEELGQAIVFEI